MANVKRPFRRTGSLRGMFNRKRETPYQSWEDEDSLLEEGTDQCSERTAGLRRLEFREDSPQSEERDGSSGSNVTEAAGSELPLGDCFYLGRYDMTGLGIRGRGASTSQPGTSGSGARRSGRSAARAPSPPE